MGGEIYASKIAVVTVVTIEAFKKDIILFLQMAGEDIKFKMSLSKLETVKGKKAEAMETVEWEGGKKRKRVEAGKTHFIWSNLDSRQNMIVDGSEESYLISRIYEIFLNNIHFRWRMFFFLLLSLLSHQLIISL